MLEQKKENLIGKVVSLLLLSGQELIGKLAIVSDKLYCIDKPRMLVQTPDGKGFGLGPIMATGDTNAVHEFERDKVVLLVPTVQELVNHYQQSTSSVILPKSGLIDKIGL